MNVDYQRSWYKILILPIESKHFQLLEHYIVEERLYDVAIAIVVVVLQFD